MIDTNIKKNSFEVSEEFLHNILNSVADPIFVKDANYKFVFANKALCDMLGMKKEDIIGKTLGESLPKTQMDLFLKNDKMVLESGKENISQEPLSGQNGKILTIVTKKTRYTDDKGNKFLIGVIRDITEQIESKSKIKEKTEEVEKLEKMTRIMVGREVKMAELKEENERLKKENDSLKKN
jgi:PAS domain S-box-containing protein